MNKKDTKHVYKNLTVESIKNYLEDITFGLKAKESKDYYKETRFEDGSIRIESSFGTLWGGPGFTKEFDEAFDKAMKEEAKKYLNNTDEGFKEEL